MLIDRKIDGFPAHFVGVDDVEVGRIATEHLLNVGCHNPAHIGGPDVSTAVGRAQGYREVLARRNIEERPHTVIMREHGDDAGDHTGYLAMKRLLGLKPRPDGVFCYNDPTAMGAMKAVLEAGLDVPNDVSVVGCGNVTYADFIRFRSLVSISRATRSASGLPKLALSVLAHFSPKQSCCNPACRACVDAKSERRKR